MPRIQPPDSLHLQAAQGWLGLGNPAEAQQELEKIPRRMWTHTEVLKVRWEICAVQKQWEPSLEVATVLIKADPEDPIGWVHRSYALHELKRTREARDHLLSVVDKFPISATIRYNLACYECQLGNLVEARKWLKITFRMGDQGQMKAMALEDPDLKPLWPELDRLDLSK